MQLIATIWKIIRIFKKTTITKECIPSSHLRFVIVENRFTPDLQTPSILFDIAFAGEHVQSVQMADQGCVSAQHIALNEGYLAADVWHKIRTDAVHDTLHVQEQQSVFCVDELPGEDFLCYRSVAVRLDQACYPVRVRMQDIQQTGVDARLQKFCVINVFQEWLESSQEFWKG